MNIHVTSSDGAMSNTDGAMNTGNEDGALSPGPPDKDHFYQGSTIKIDQPVGSVSLENIII